MLDVGSGGGWPSGGTGFTHRNQSDSFEAASRWETRRAEGGRCSPGETRLSSRGRCHQVKRGGMHSLVGVVDNRLKYTHLWGTRGLHDFYFEEEKNRKIYRQQKICKKKQRADTSSGC